jgi:hypothetical protein
LLNPGITDPTEARGCRHREHDHPSEAPVQVSPAGAVAPVAEIDFLASEADLQSDFDSEDESKTPNFNYQKYYDLLKFLCVLLYQTSLLLFVAFYSTSRFESVEVKQLFWLFLAARPVVVCSYSTFIGIFSLRRTYYVT